MTRFVGIKNDNICIVSDVNFNSTDLLVVELPDELNNMPFGDLVLNYKFKNGKFVNKKMAKKATELRVALIGNWKVKCGISTYAESLWPQIAKSVKDFKLFIEKNDKYTGDIYQMGSQMLPKDKVIECWKRGDNLQSLISEIKAYDPDIVWIQHEFGLWPNAGYWLVLMTQLSEYRVIVTMHSVFHHKDKTICEAAMPEIVTHLSGGQRVLKEEKHVPGKVYTIPHGCDPCLDKSKLWNYYKSEHTLIQAGFGFRYKNFEASIKTISFLQEKYPDIFLTILFSESDGNIVEHQLYYNELMNLIRELRLQNNVAIIRGFQSDETMDSYLRTNQIAIFPYKSNVEHEVFGASGAARLAMSKGIVVLTSSVNHFSDVPALKADTAEEMATILGELFANENVKNIQLNKQFEFIEVNSWSNIAQQYIKLFEK